MSMSSPEVMIAMNTFLNTYQSGGVYQHTPRPMSMNFTPMVVRRSANPHYMGAILRYYTGSSTHYLGRKIISTKLMGKAIVIGTDNGVFIVTR